MNTTNRRSSAVLNYRDFRSTCRNHATTLFYQKPTLFLWLWISLKICVLLCRGEHLITILLIDLVEYRLTASEALGSSPSLKKYQKQHLTPRRSLITSVPISTPSGKGCCKLTREAAMKAINCSEYWNNYELFYVFVAKWGFWAIALQYWWSNTGNPTRNELKIVTTTAGGIMCYYLCSIIYIQISVSYSAYVARNKHNVAMIYADSLWIKGRTCDIVNFCLRFQFSVGPQMWKKMASINLILLFSLEIVHFLRCKFTVKICSVL